MVRVDVDAAMLARRLRLDLEQCLDGRLAPEDGAALVPFLASDDARLITGHEYWGYAGLR